MTTAATSKDNGQAKRDIVESTSPRDEYDTPWKEIIEEFLGELLAFLLPELYQSIDWSRTPEFLDQELARVLVDATATNRRVDKLIKVWLKDGTERWLLLHIEVQGDKDPEFEERMFQCYYRIYDLFRMMVVGVALLADMNDGWRPGEYRSGLFGSQIVYRFNAIKLLDYMDREEELKASASPFATILLAHLYAKKTKGHEEWRYQVKKEIIRGLYQKGFDHQKIRQLLRFIDWVLQLSKVANQQLSRELAEFEGESKMPSYVTSFEQIGMEKGEQKGRQEEGSSILLRQLRRRFQTLPGWVEQKVIDANLELLGEWADRFVDARSLEDIFGDDRQAAH
ncbi:MAG: DUF4351 domain-containing protein [Magnetococcales bacterium]|nr:DUF4351 domain-containing protein [Magnetococcales bacterium]